MRKIVQLRDIDVFEVALARDPINKKKFYAVKDAASDKAALDAKALADKEAADKDAKEKVDKDAADKAAKEKADKDAADLKVYTDAKAIVDAKEKADKDAAAVPASPEDLDAAGKALKDQITALKDVPAQVAALAETVNKIVGVLKDATLIPDTEPEKTASTKDGADELGESFMPFIEKEK